MHKQLQDELEDKIRHRKRSQSVTGRGEEGGEAGLGRVAGQDLGHASGETAQASQV